MKVWDIGGQVQFRREWGKYTKGCDAIIFMIDASNVNLYIFNERYIANCEKRIKYIVRSQRNSWNTITFHW